MKKQKTLKPVSQLKGIKSVKQLYSTPRRWNKGNLTNSDGTAVCMLGAIGHVYGQYNDVVVKVEEKVKRAISAFYKTRCGQAKKVAIESFNDSRTRKFEDIKWVINAAKV